MLEDRRTTNDVEHRPVSDDKPAFPIGSWVAIDNSGKVLASARTLEELSIIVAHESPGEMYRVRQLSGHDQPVQTAHDWVEQLAYQLWERRGRRPGRNEKDWREAEDILHDRLDKMGVGRHFGLGADGMAHLQDEARWGRALEETEVPEPVGSLRLILPKPPPVHVANWADVVEALATETMRLSDLTWKQF